jgi:hypothetical protein
VNTSAGQVELAAHVRRMRRLGAVLGLATGPAAGFGQAWAGTGDGRLHVWVIASAVAAVLGAVTLPVFYPPAPEAKEPLVLPGPGPGFAALFGLAVGLVAGAFAAFPMGAVMGGFGGALGAAVAGLLWRRLGIVPAAVVGPVVGLVGVWVWTGGLS